MSYKSHESRFSASASRLAGPDTRKAACGVDHPSEAVSRYVNVSRESLVVASRVISHSVIVERHLHGDVKILDVVDPTILLTQTGKNEENTRGFGVSMTYTDMVLLKILACLH